MNKVDIPTAGVDARDTDALECLLALCRIMCLTYEITRDTQGRGYTVKVAWRDWPTDFFEPCRRDGSYAIVGSDNPVSALRAAINGAIGSLRRNAEEFSRGFKDYWKENTGCQWGHESLEEKRETV